MLLYLHLHLYLYMYLYLNLHLYLYLPGEDSRESNKALGIEEPECVYACVRASEFGANSL